MSWKCEICDTYNDESKTSCFVCGQARSAASIREGKIRAKEERKQRIQNAICEKGYTFAKKILLAGYASCAIILTIAMLIYQVQGDIDILLINLYDVFGNMENNLSMAFSDNAYFVLQSMIETPVLNIDQNIEYIAASWGDFLNGIPEAAYEIFMVNAKNNIEYGFISSVEQLVDLSDKNLVNIDSMIITLQDKFEQKFFSLMNFFIGLYENVQQYF